MNGGPFTTVKDVENLLHRMVKPMAGLETGFLKNRLKNPLFLASGVLGVTKASLEDMAEHGAAGLITKSLSLEPRKGHETPILVETPAGFLNAVGYANPGIEEGLKEFAGWKRKEMLVISIVGKNENEFAQLANKVQKAIDAKTLRCGAVEAVLSCPHTPGFGLMAGQQTPENADKITKAIKNELSSVPLIVKISPGVPGEVGVAKAVEKAGADALDVGNTTGPGMVIDIEQRAPVLGFQMGGLSGPALRPLTVRCIYDVYKEVSIPIMGTGGVTYGKDAVELAMAGAGVLGIGTAVYYRGKEVFAKLAGEIEVWLKGHDHKNLKEIVGAVHPK